MGFMRTDIDTAKDEEERKELEELFQRYLQCDSWAIKTIPYKRILKLKKPEAEGYRKTRPPYNVGVLLTSHPGNRAYLKASVETHSKLGLWITLAYDNYLDPERQEITPNDVFPARDVMDKVDCFIMPHHQVWSGVLYPYFWLLKFGIAAMSDFEYIWCTNGDCIIEKPENFPQIVEMLGDGDIMGVGWEDNNGRPLFNTTAFLAKTKAAKKIIKHFEEHFIPFETFEKWTMDIGNCEGRFARAIQDLKLKLVKVKDNPFNTQAHVSQGTFYDIIGWKHIHGEHSYAYKIKGIPPEIKWFDERFIGDEFKRIKGYWENKDIDPQKAREFLEDWWPK